ncbi:MAG: SUMF1/EgtB/PvdO family nonheme iron enzyme [Gammaproteobacteria bacterium]|nr:SUMF1/EgtB/PvdO family nonheme iron enzyme [Gammaproteobacteria bacterium]
MLPEDNIEALQRQIAELQARLSTAQQASVSVPGAVAQDGGDALGQSAVNVKGDNTGAIITGTQIVINYHAAVSGRLTREEIAQRVEGYLRWLQARTKDIELRGIERAGGAPVVLLPLETAYVPLRAKWMRWDDTDIALNQVLGLGHRLVIVGGPGSGKTTVLLHMAWALASSLLSGQPDPVRARLGSLRKSSELSKPCEPSELPLPIFVPLASFARYRRNLAGNSSAKEKTLAYFISYHLSSKQADFDLPADFFEQLIKDGQDVLLLLDGLDEVANEHERAEVRQSMEELVSGREAMRVVVTCRTIAYRNGRTALGANFREVVVQPLDLEQHITLMVRQAYACIYPHDTALRTDRTEDLLVGIQRLEAERRTRLGQQTEALVNSPLMVRLLLIVHFNNRTLPAERADLFDKAINALLQVDYGREEGDIRELATDWKLYRDMAQQLAFHMHQQGDDQGREIEEPALKKVLCKEIEFKPHIDNFLSHARQRGSVLEEHGGIYRFIHLALQEFLVARYLREVTGAEGRSAILVFLDRWLEDLWWREPILLLAGYMAANAARSARDFLSALARAGSQPNAQFTAAELAGTAALEWRDSGEALRTDCARRIVELLSDAKALANSHPVIRARAGDALARLGDLRFDPQHFYLPVDDNFGFVHIPADPEFVIGTRKVDAQQVDKIISVKVFDSEINGICTPTSEFYIARYLVTVAQFRAFIEATQFKIGNARALRDPDNRPVCSVSWREALAYCDWLNDLLAHSPAFESSEIARLVRKCGWRVTLPSELKWEKAARGRLQDTIFSWGDEFDPNRANYPDSKIEDTSTVGCFPANDFGLYDMIGNVFEWTHSYFSSYPYRAEDDRENLEAVDDVLRVMRGGSWRDDPDFTRCAYRLRSRPNLCFDYFGFRVALCSTPVQPL